MSREGLASLSLESHLSPFVVTPPRMFRSENGLRLMSVRCGKTQTERAAFFSDSKKECVRFLSVEMKTKL